MVLSQCQSMVSGVGSVRFWCMVLSQCQSLVLSQCQSLVYGVESVSESGVWC